MVKIRMFRWSFRQRFSVKKHPIANTHMAMAMIKKSPNETTAKELDDIHECDIVYIWTWIWESLLNVDTVLNRCFKHFYMSEHMITVVCADDLAVVIDPAEVKDTFPRVLKRFLDVPADADDTIALGKPHRDEFGRLTFAKTFGITRNHFVACLAFLRSGHVTYLDPLVETFTILGGCAELDAYVIQKQAAEDARQSLREAEEIQRRANPKCPEDDLDQHYIFRPHYVTWDPPGPGWTAIGPTENQSVFWWRCRRPEEQ